MSFIAWLKSIFSKKKKKRTYYPAPMPSHYPSSVDHLSSNRGNRTYYQPPTVITETIVEEAYIEPVIIDTVINIVEDIVLLDPPVIEINDSIPNPVDNSYNEPINDNYSSDSGDFTTYDDGN